MALLTMARLARPGASFDEHMLRRGCQRLCLLGVQIKREVIAEEFLDGQRLECILIFFRLDDDYRTGRQFVGLLEPEFGQQPCSALNTSSLCSCQ